MRTLFILNEAPYGSERAYNAVAHEPEQEVRVFLMGDAALVAKRGQHPPAGFYNLQVMLGKIVRIAPERVGVCGVCMEARGMSDEEMLPGSHRGSIEELAQWTIWADKVLVF